MSSRLSNAAAQRLQMQIAFLGTSATPSLHRNASCILFKLGQMLHVFDCGEGSFRQFQKSTFHSHEIDKIFITHMHGDHVWGLPGFLCGATSEKAIEIYGPQGLRGWLRTTLNALHQRVVSKYLVHELILNKVKIPGKVSTLHVPNSPHEDELPGEDISCSIDDVWHLFEDDIYGVKAGILEHNAPCWGYVIQEHSTSDEVKGRKVVILGDTKNSRALEQVAKDTDVLVHEATLFTEARDKSHSTPGIYISAVSSQTIDANIRSGVCVAMAGEFARSVNAKCLILTHLSGSTKYTEKDFKDAARRTFKRDSVIVAKDFLTLTVV